MNDLQERFEELKEENALASEKIIHLTSELQKEKNGKDTASKSLSQINR